MTVRCKTHQRFFTAYLPGWLPFKRVPLLYLDPRGEPLAPSKPDRDPRAGTLLELPSIPSRARRTVDTDNAYQAARRQTEARTRSRKLAFLEKLSGLLEPTLLRERLARVLLVPLPLWMTARALGRGLAARREKLAVLWGAVQWGIGSLWRWMAAGELYGVFGKAWIAWPVQGSIPLLAGAANVPLQAPECVTMENSL